MLIIIVLAGAFLRLWQLPNLPPGLWYDEAYNAMDAVWMLDQQSPHIFFEGNNGREPLFNYLAAFSMAVLSPSPYSLRLVSALVGILTIALTFKWVIILWANHPDRYWLGLMAATGLAFSIWHVVMSRIGFRTILLPPFVLLTTYFFWQGLRKPTSLKFATTGLFLGISLYTYLPARLLPLLLILFVSTCIVLGIRLFNPSITVSGKAKFAITTTIVFLIASAPLGIFFWNHFQDFWGRSADVSVFNAIGQGKIGVFEHVLQALSVFIGWWDPKWRHNIVGQLGFNIIILSGFLWGIVVSIKNYRQPAYLFTLHGVLIFWLPSLFATPATTTIRLSAMLPFYYIVAAIGLLSISRWVDQWFRSGKTIQWGVLFLASTVGFTLTLHGYFVRWGHEPAVYDEFNGAIVDVTHQLINESKNHNLLVPFEFYRYPTVRFLLHREFKFTDFSINGVFERSTKLLPSSTTNQLLSSYNQLPSNYYVWLTRNKAGVGQVHLSRQELATYLEADFSSSQLLQPSVSNTLQRQTSVELMAVDDLDPFVSLFTEVVNTQGLDYTWADQFKLVDYQLQPKLVQPGQTSILKLYWQLPPGELPRHSANIQMINVNGDIVGQWREPAFPRLVSLWRDQPVTVNNQHKLFISSDAVPGTYLLHLSLIDGDTGKFLVESTTSLDEGIALGLIQVGSEEYLVQPDFSVQIQFDDNIKLTGYSSPVIVIDNTPIVQGRIYWQTDDTVQHDYIIFAELIDENNQSLTRRELSPYGAYYPTSRWKPDEIIVAEFTLPLPEQVSFETNERYKLVVGMMNVADQTPLLIFNPTSKIYADEFFVIGQAKTSR